MQFKFHSKIGPLYLVATLKGLQGIYWEKQNIPMAKENPFFKQVMLEINEYLVGKRTDFDIALDLQGTEFQLKVWKELMKIPYGKTISYKELAYRIKQKTAVRAVGTANGKNPLCIIVPCHRVIASSGKLGGYSGGLKIKEKLLNLES